MPDVIASDGDIRIRPMTDTDEDYSRYARWRNQPHVREWWDPDDPPMTVEAAHQECGPSTVGIDPTAMCIIEVDERPIGFVQFFPWSAYLEDLEKTELTVPDGSWSLDLYIGEFDALNRGTGSRVVRMVCDYLFAKHHATAVAFGVEKINARAIRAYEKAGMTPTVDFLDTDTRNGERVQSFLMLRKANES